MNEKLSESLSALLDDEANELEIERVLAHATDDELRQTWTRYNLAQQAAAGGQVQAATMPCGQGEFAGGTDDSPGRLRHGNGFRCTGLGLDKEQPARRRPHEAIATVVATRAHSGYRLE